MILQRPELIQKQFMNLLPCPFIGQGSSFIFFSGLGRVMNQRVGDHVAVIDQLLLGITDIGVQSPFGSLSAPLTP